MEPVAYTLDELKAHHKHVRKQMAKDGVSLEKQEEISYLMLMAEEKAEMKTRAFMLRSKFTRRILPIHRKTKYLNR